MKKILIAACFMTGFASFAQTAETTLDPMKDKDLMTWYHKDFSAANVYGVNTQNAYKYLESKGLKPKPVIVGVLDSGVEVDHPGLIKNMWKNPNEVKKEYPSASILNDNRIVFNIKGNNYRLIVRINYNYQMIWIRFIGTHAEYDKVNANEI